MGSVCVCQGFRSKYLAPDNVTGKILIYRTFNNLPDVHMLTEGMHTEGILNKNVKCFSHFSLAEIKDPRNCP